jgi:hypothetical protein
LTGVNIVIVLLAGYGSLHSMESPQFCGQACHTPMHPQFIRLAERAALGSHVRAMPTSVRGRAFVKYKLNGLRQMYHVGDRATIPRPIPGVADLRPAAQVCGTVHLARQGIRRHRPRQARVRRGRDEHGDIDDPAVVPGRSPVRRRRPVAPFTGTPIRA